MDNFMAAFAGEMLEKVSYGILQALKSGRRAKAIQLPKAGGRQVSRQVPGGMLAIPKESPATRGTLLRAGMPPEAVESATKSLRSLTRGKSRIAADPGVIKTLDKGDKLINPAAKRLTPKERILEQGHMKQHELDELVAMKKRKKSPTAARYGHHDWSVILKEHNRTSTLPAEAANLKKRWQGVRSLGEAKVLRRAGVRYGEGRVSRHARKRLAQIIERKEGLAHARAAAKAAPKVKGGGTSVRDKSFKKRLFGKKPTPKKTVTKWPTSPRRKTDPELIERLEKAMKGRRR